MSDQKKKLSLKQPTKVEDEEPEVEVTERSYFVDQDKENLEFFSTGSTLLDCALGGGLPLGRVSNVVGDNSTGKCIRDAYILSESGLTHIDSLGQKMPGDLVPWEQKLSIDANSYDHASHFYRENVTETIKITTRHGYQLHCTPEHPIKIWRKTTDADLGYEMVRAENLKKGNFAVIAHGTERFGDNKTISPVEAYLLGAAMSKGALYRNKFHILITSNAHLNELLYCVEALKLKFEVAQPRLYIRSSYFLSMISPYLRNGSGKPVEVPDYVLTAPRDVQIQFIRGFFDTSLSLGRGGQIELSKPSEKLMRQIQLMLLNFGVVCSLSKRTSVRGREGLDPYEHTKYLLRICTKFYHKYKKEIGSDVFEFACTPNTDYTNFDRIPYLIEKMQADRAIMSERWGVYRNGVIKGTNGRKFAKWVWHTYENGSYSILDHFIETYKEFFDKLDDKGMFYYALKESKHHFDEIVKIEVDNHTPYQVYDVHVPESHLFWSNGFISHNTLIATEAAANFLQCYPDGKVQYAEYEAAFDTDYAGALGIPVDKIEFPIEDGTIPDRTLENLGEYIQREAAQAMKDNSPRFLVVDSLDAVSDKAEMERSLTDNTFGAAKAKLMSEVFRKFIGDVEASRMHLMVISQIRDNIGVSFGAKSKRSGGKALDFYASQIFWLHHGGQMKKVVRKVTRVIGIDIKAKVKKNKIGIPYRECEFPILFGYGIDDLSSMVTWLMSLADGPDLTTYYEGTAKKITDKVIVESILRRDDDEQDEIIEEIKGHAVEQWMELEQLFMPKRKGKY